MYALWRLDGRFVTCFFGGKEADHICRLSDSRATDYALQALSEGLPLCSIGNLAEHVKCSHVTRWGVDPLALGSYSAATIGRSASRKELTKPVEKRLFFAGEATERTWAARVYGAYLSGENAAAEVHEALRNRKARGA
jgi:monoamine oxidase